MSKNLKEFISECENKYKERIAFTYPVDGIEVNKTYKELGNDINNLGAYILKEGFYDCNISLVGENSYEYIVTYFAIIGGKNTVVPIDKDLSGEQIGEQIARTKSACVFYSKSVEHKIDRSDTQNNIKYFCLENILNIENISTDDYKKIEIDENDTASIIFTSGTTGISKGVMLSHRNILSCAKYCLKTSGINFLDNNRTVIVLPLHHTYGMVAGVMAVLNEGTSNYINKNLSEFIKNIDEYKPNVLFFVPLFIENLNRIMNKGFLKNHEIKYIISGGAMLDNKYLQAFEKIGISIMNGYGITECAPVVSLNSKRKENSIGTPICYNKVQIDSPDENGEGEILVKGSNVMQGYYENEEATQETFQGEWFRTGDYGRIDEEGGLYITGRKKNIIILSNGKNIYPEELEAQVYNIPLVKEALVYSCDDDKISLEVFFDKEYINAFGIEHPKEEFDKALNQLNSGLPFYKKIQEYDIRDIEFPKTSTKKIKRGIQKKKENESINHTNRVVNTKTEIRLVEVLKKEYQQQEIYLDDRIFKIINDSLSAITTICELEEAFRTRIPCEILSDNPSIEELGVRIDYFIKNKDENDENIEINLDNLKVKPRNNNLNYLLTGATGFFGVHLLRECMKERKVYCLVRDLNKFQACLKYYLGLKEHSNIIPLQGDVTKPDFGLSQSELELIKMDVGVIINSAADVKHFGSLESSKRTNVDGIINAIYLAAKIGAKLEHISTMTVCGEGLVNQTTNDIFDEDSLYIGQNYKENIYVHSKYLAEKAIHIAREKGLVTNIYRLGNLTERASDGLFQMNSSENGFRARINAINAVRALPEELFDMPIDYTNVDECAKAVKLLFNLDENNETYHMYNHNTISLFDYVKEYDLDIDRVSFNEFVKRLKNISHKNNSARFLLLYLSRMSQGEKFRRVNIRSNKTINRLNKSGFEWKKFNFDNIVQFKLDKKRDNDVSA